jgi:hypothetical protein
MGARPGAGALLLALALLAAAGCGERAAAPIEPSRAAPDFALPRIGGGELSLRALRSKVVLMNF